MKRHFLKTVLPGFVFVLAIFASFAFKPAPNDTGSIYIQLLPPQFCTLLLDQVPSECSIYNWGANCTTSLFGLSFNLHSRVWGLICSDVYRLPY
ncbi:DUF6520 family protein [Flavivirga sp. 57AJ16]|uniref:DUF6520 family protein n=1 Tax=Flavivirga sp. 57AJ16 TaxID=3025307 RepID=UPI002365394F|nr:DUF6520 family protein [Flavivirga sp. 57AJ16]MDD7886114.1 DUF6520 family protein [Flavivirga sp. 57AJ16]